MAIDLTGGIDPAREFVFGERPDDPEMRDSVSFWVSDDRGEIGLPRVGIEAVAEHWEEHGLQVNLAFPDGRAYRLRTDGKAWPAEDDMGRPTVLGAGPLGFRCVEPFRHLDDDLRGPGGADLDVRPRRREEGRPARRRAVLRRGHLGRAAVDPRIAVARGPRRDRGLRRGRPDGRAPLRAALPRRRVGHHARGTSTTFTGSGLRIRRQGVRRLAEFRGHCWQSALFPSGKGFGYIAYPPRDDGQPTFNEGYVFSGDGELIPARVVQAPWIDKLQALGQDVSLVLETEGRRVRIEGETVVSSWDIAHDDPTWAVQAMTKEVNFPPLQQAGVRYRWDGEETYGMLERSYPLDKIAGG